MASRPTNKGKEATKPLAPVGYGSAAKMANTEVAMHKRIQGIKTPGVMGKMRMSLLDGSDSNDDDEKDDEESNQEEIQPGSSPGRGWTYGGNGTESETEVVVGNDIDTDVEMEDPADDDWDAPARRRLKTANGPCQKVDKPALAQNLTVRSAPGAMSVKTKTAAPKKEVKAGTGQVALANVSVPMLVPSTPSATAKPKLIFVSPQHYQQLNDHSAQCQKLHAPIVSENGLLKEQLALKDQEIKKIRKENHELGYKIALYSECAIEWARREAVLYTRMRYLEGEMMKVAMMK